MPLEMMLDGGTGIVFTRRFAAAPDRVFRAHTDCALLKRWMYGWEGWSLARCDYDARPGGTMLFRWEPGADAEGEAFEMTGEILEIEPPRRIVHVERMHLGETTPDNRIETTFEPDGDGTLMTMRMSLPSSEMREQMLATGMADGMEASLSRIDGLFGGA